MTRSSKIDAYRRATSPLPERHWIWPLYGQGLESLGRDGQPIAVPLPIPGPDELLVRHDAVGLCFSDTKVISAGESHPRLNGRNMRENPVVLGHEVALTVVAVGECLLDRFSCGERYIIQADIYYQGIGLAYGYALQGGLSQYNVVGKEILNGDEGCYLLPMSEETGYAQGALTEPWACVVASYGIAYRTRWKGGGRVLVAAGPATDPATSLGDPFDPEDLPSEIVALGLPERLKVELLSAAGERGVTCVSADTLEGLPGGAWDDIVLLGPDAALYERLEPLAARGAILALIGAEGLDAPAQVDIGRLHYDHIGLLGTASTRIEAAYAPIRGDLLPGGRLALVGAAGPMGQMHFQRALQADTPPRLIVATSRVMDRLALLPAKFAELIASHSNETQVLTMASQGRQPKAFNRQMWDATEGEGYDDVIILAPSALVVSDALAMMASGGVVNVFAGLPRGTRGPLDLCAVVERGVRLVGSSGSLIGDLRHMLDVTETGALDPNLSVVAIAGLCAAREGLEGVMNSRYPGKVVIYPQVLDFPLTMLSDLEDRLPRVHALLGPNASWTVAAERAFLEELLP
ncbi:MAG: alcohol dehydrogenase catalytic domain-containing protein [Chloroflexi bacterium]|nr:alcohol dehydrogenase catalytic domain-containing protein [Chloroflexota bacterium]